MKLRKSATFEMYNDQHKLEMDVLPLPASSLTHQIDEGEEDDDDGGDGALGDRVVHVGDDARDRLPEPRRAQRVPDRLKQNNRVPCCFVLICLHHVHQKFALQQLPL